MIGGHWQKVHTHWPMTFVIIVVLYFVMTAFDVRDRIPSFGDNNGSEQTATADSGTTSTTSTTIAVKPGAFKYEVVGFHLDYDKKHPTTLSGNVSLQVRNTTGSNLKFDATELRLIRVDDGATSQPVLADKAPLTIASKSSMIVPVTFRVSPKPGAEYKLTYRGQTIFTGKPF